MAFHNNCWHDVYVYTIYKNIATILGMYIYMCTYVVFIFMNVSFYILYL